MKITIIGSGKMALALAKGLEAKNELTIVGRDSKKLLQFTKQLLKDTKRVLLNNYDIDGQIVLLCIKPYALKDISTHIKGKAKTIYSILAGTDIANIKKAIKAEYYVRAMPNLAASFNSSMTTLTGDDEKKDEAKELFLAIGKTLWVESEKELDIATAIAGSGPAFLAMVAEALADGGVKEGLRRSEAMELVKGLFWGFSSLLENNHPAMIKDAVMSPGGTTAAGYASLEEKGVRNSFIKAIQAAYDKAKNNSFA